MDQEQTNPANQEIQENRVGQKKTFTSKQKIIRETKIIFLIIFVVFAFRSIVVEPYRIPSGSMIPTLMIGDFILVNKLSYGLKIPFSDTFSDPIYITTPQNPERGDVIVFKYPREATMSYIKRVIGIPGDTVEVKDKEVFVNGQMVPRKPIDGKAMMADMDDKFKGFRLRFYEAKLGENKFIYQVDEDNYYKTNFEKIVVPPGKFFVMGDNRDFSSDSRYWGFVSHEHIKGKAQMVWLSVIFPFGDNEWRFRPQRIGTIIH